MTSVKHELIPIHVTPKSSKNAVEGWVEDAAGQKWLKVKLTTAPEDGKANKALLKLLAKEWGCAVSSLSIIQGETSRKKLIERSV